MIKKQLSRLCTVEHCFLFEGKVFERLEGKRYKYRVMFSDDDYDYVVDKRLKRQLDLFVANLEKEES